MASATSSTNMIDPVQLQSLINKMSSDLEVKKGNKELTREIDAVMKQFAQVFTMRGLKSLLHRATFMNNNLQMTMDLFRESAPEIASGLEEKFRSVNEKALRISILYKNIQIVYGSYKTETGKESEEANFDFNIAAAPPYMKVSYFIDDEHSDGWFERGLLTELSKFQDVAGLQNEAIRVDELYQFSIDACNYIADEHLTKWEIVDPVLLGRLRRLMRRHKDLGLTPNALAKTVNKLNRVIKTAKRKFDSLTDQEYETLRSYRERRENAMKFLSVYKCDTLDVQTLEWVITKLEEFSLPENKHRSMGWRDCHLRDWSMGFPKS